MHVKSCVFLNGRNGGGGVGYFRGGLFPGKIDEGIFLFLLNKKMKS